MSDNVLDVIKFDAGIQTENGYEQFSMTNTIGNLIGNREYKESFDKFKNGNNDSDSYIWKTLSAVSDQTGSILYENIKNYIDYVTNIDICKIQSLRSMIKIYGLNYKIFDSLDILPNEILDLINIFSINKKYILYGNTLLDKYKNYLSSEDIKAIYNYNEIDNEDIPISANIISSVINYNYPIGGKYYDFVVKSFNNVLNNFLNLSYEENGQPIYKLKGDDGIYNDLIKNRSKYTQAYQKDTKEYDRRKYKIQHNISLQFDECAALDRIEKGIDSESMYSGAKAELIQMEKDWRLKSFNNNKTSRYAFYKKQRVLEYANFITNKYFADHKSENLSSYSYNKDYFEVGFKKGSGENAETIYADTGVKLINSDNNNYTLNTEMIHDVAQSLADTAFYISNIREKIKLQTRKNYMKGTYDLMLYVINEFLVDYSRTNPIFRNTDTLNISNEVITIEELLKPIYVSLSSHDINNLTAIEYFDETEYFNIATQSDNKSEIFGTNDRFWQNPGGESLIKHNGVDSDFDINSITSFYMDTLGIRDNYISDENTLCAFLDAVFNLGAVDSFIHKVSSDYNGELSSASELFGTQIEKYGKYSDDLYNNYLNLKQSWTTFTSYLSNEKYEYQISDCVSAQALSVAEYIKQLIYNREFASVSAVYNKYIENVNEISSNVNQCIESYNNLLSGEYSFYFSRADGYKYCFDGDEYKHEYYINSNWDLGLEYLYDMLYKIKDYASNFDDNGNYITNWPIHDTVKYFYNSFIDLSSKYISMITGQQVPDIGLNISHNWSTAYGFVDISAVSLENEFKYGYDFINENIKARKQFILDKLNNLKSQSIDLSNKSQNIKNSLTQAIAQYRDGNPEVNLGESYIYAVSLNKAKSDYMEFSRCQRSSDPNSKGYLWKIEKVIAGKTYYYYDNEKGTGEWAYDITSIPAYNENASILSRCNAIKKYMEAPTTFYILTQDNSYYNQYNYELMDEGVFAAVTQVESDFISLQNSINILVNEINNAGFELELSDSTDIDASINEIIAFLNSQVDENIVENDNKIKDYKLYISAIIKLSAMYTPIKYEYDSIFKDQKQAIYLSEFQPDIEMTLAALSRLSSYNIDKDNNNKNTIIQTIDQLQQTYQDIVLSYQKLANDLSKEYMLPQEFQPYIGYIEEMLNLMYDALNADVNNKIVVANNIAQNEFDTKLYPAASRLIICLSPYENYLQELPIIVNKKLKELYYFNNSNYLKQKEMFLTYGGRSFCYYPYFNLKNTVHSSYQVHPFLWNFVKREHIYGIVYKTFFSVNIDELEKENIAQNWHKFYGEYGEIKYNDISKQRYPDYSGYQSRYEDSIHIAENTQFVSEVVDYDGAFYPPAIEWIKTNGLDKAIASIRDLKYNQNMIIKACSDIYELSSLNWENIFSNLIWMNKYKSDSSINTLTSNVYNKFYNNINNLNFTKYDICNFIKQELSSDDTFYGRFYRQLRFDQDNQIQNKEYIIEQLNEYWSNHNGNGPSISDITENCTIDKVHDIYKYGIDSYGNMYCLYKQYDQNLYYSDILSNNDLSYKYKQSTPGELWIRFKNHPIAFPAFSGSHPNVYIKSRNKRHSAFVNLFDLYKRDIDNNIILENNEPIQLIDNEVSAIQVSKTSCIYDFEFTKDKNDITFITQMYNNNLSCQSRDIQNYQNSWLVHCRPTYDVLTSNIDYDMSIFRLYSPSEEVDYFQSGDNYDQISKLSDLTVLDNGCTLYQYIGSYLKGNSNIYHVYAKKYIYRDEFNNVVKEAYNQIKIYPVINGKYSKNNDIIGNLIEDNSLSIVGPDICMAYNESTNILHFAAQTILADNTEIYTDSGKIYLSSNVNGPIISDPLNSNMNSHDIFDTNITLFKKQIVSKQLRDIRNINEQAYTFNTNADISYFPAYPGLNGITKLYRKSEYYDHYSIELLGTAKDISQQISFVNPNPDPYLNTDSILSNFADARVYQDYLEYTDETLKTIDNELIGCNSKIFVNNQSEKINQAQIVFKGSDNFIWQIRLNTIYQNFDLNNIKKLKILLFNKKCYGKNPYIFIDINKLIGNKWFKLQYDNEENILTNYNTISVSDYISGYNNQILVQSTLNGLGDTEINNSNHIYNIDSILARLIIDEKLNQATLEFKFMLINPSIINYTFIAEQLLQIVLLDTKNLEIFNYFHYLDTYGVLRVIDYFKSIEEINANRIKYGDGWKIYHAGYNFSEEELMNKLKSYYEYRNKMIPLSSVDLSQYNCLSDVYILQGSRKLAFKQDESFRYELSHPGYFYPTINAKFPINPAQYMMQYTSFKEDIIIENQQNIFNDNNLFILDIENPQTMLSSIGKIDIPIILDDSEYIFAYEDYLDINEDNINNRRNCDLYDNTDSYVLQFIQFEANDIPFEIVNENKSFEIPDNIIKNISIEDAVNKIIEYLNKQNITNVQPLFSEQYHNKYIQEYVGFTIDNNSLTEQQMIDLLRIYVNYRKYNVDGEEKIELYFNYMNYLNSPYLKIQDNKTYIDTIDNTYLSLKQDEEGTLNIIAQFKYYNGEILHGYRNAKLASYQIYNISDDKPKFIIKKIDTITKNKESNENIQPISQITVCDTNIDITKFNNKNEYISFDLSFILETNTKLKSIEFYLDYPSDFIEFISLDAQKTVTGKDWSLHVEQPGYAKIIMNPLSRSITIPVKSLYSVTELQNQGNQDFILYIDNSIIIGQNNIQAQTKHIYGKVSIHARQIYNKLNVLLTEEDVINNQKYIFNTEYSPSLVKAYILENKN